ncbi:MAG TPA: hypothetical protein VG324_02580 [Blastocatellia bacterium]|nr:hypothetical protein [Blastocatellia bacterium]
MSEQKSRSTIVRIGIIALVAGLASVVAAVVQQALFGKTHVAGTFVAVLVALLIVARRVK